MGRRELLELVREVSKIVFSDGDDMSSEEKVIRVKALLIDSLTENNGAPVVLFENDDIKNK